MNKQSLVASDDALETTGDPVKLTTYPKPLNEEARLEALYSLNILDTPADERFDRVARLAAAYFNTPMARVTFVDRDRTWYKACVGSQATENNRTNALCAHTVMSDEVLVSRDLSQDPRFCNFPQVTDDPRLRFYAAAPIVLEDGARIGSVCVFDTWPRQGFSKQDGRFLADLAEIVLQELKLHKQIVSGGESLIDTERKLTVAQGAKDRFMAIVSHELKTPLGQILGFGRLIAEQGKGSPDRDDYVDFARGICRSAEHLEELIGRIIKYSSAETGELRLSESTCKTASLLSKCRDLLRLRADTSAVRISLSITDAAPIAVYVDEVQIVEALVQVLDNAIAFSPATKAVEVQAGSSAEGGLQIHILDEGPGIHPDLIKQLMDPFTQCDESLSRSHEGIGLGLAVSRAIVELHGGGIAFMNRPTGGADVVVTLPASRNSNQQLLMGAAG